MAEATDQQMQSFFNDRVRTFADKMYLVYLLAKQHKAALGDEYARATGSNRWNDARTDGPSTLMQSGNGANPDDLLVFNSFITAFITFIEGNSDWTAFQRAVTKILGN